MIKTLITPENQDVSIHIPENYVGKEIEVLMYAVDELTQNIPPKKMKFSDFRGKLNLTEEQYIDFQNYLKEVRNEWERDI